MDEDQKRVTTPEDEDTSEIEAYLRHVRANSPQWLASYTVNHAKVEQEIVQRWGKALDHFDVLVMVAQRALIRSDEGFYALAVQQQDVVYEALHALTARACQTAKEVRVLLGAGYGPAASTRWRALHEVHVVAAFIELHGAPLASRYLQHNIVVKSKLANAVEEVWKNLGTSVPQSIADAIVEVRREYAKVKQEHASEPKFYKDDYGWATGYVSENTIIALEKAAGLADRRYAYRIASDTVHPNIAGAFAGGAKTTEGKALIIGPSPEGMLEPGSSAALSLVEASRIFLRHVLKMSEDDSPIRRELALTSLIFEPLLQDVASAFKDAE